MRALWRFIRRAALIAAAAALLIGGVLYWLIAQSLPSYDGARRVVGVSAEVEILRDAQATPHIFAETEADAYFALGFAHAQDRLWQMELLRRVARGRLTEILGPWARFAEWFGAEGLEAALIRVDGVARIFDLGGHADRAFRAQTPETQAVLEAYAAGVNAWIEIVDAEGWGGGAPEFVLLGVEMERWRPADSLAIHKLIAAALSSRAMLNELRRTRYVIAMGRDRAADLFPSALGRPMMALPPFDSEARRFFDQDDSAQDDSAQNDSAQNDFDERDALRAATELAGALATTPLFFLGPNTAAFGGASNAWAVTGARSATRAPMLAADPHLALSAPSIWYLARLDFFVADDASTDAGFGAAGDGRRRVGVIGATIPGVPAVFIGRNTDVAWGLTTFYADTADVFIERVNPANTTQYLTPSGWAAFEARAEQIALGDGRAVEVIVRRTRHGPVLPLTWGPADETSSNDPLGVTPQGHVAAVSWTVLTDDDQSVAAAMQLMRARSVAEAAEIAPLVVGPTQHVVVADRRTVGLIAVGRVPLRRADAPSQGQVLARGWTGADDWLGFLPPAALPRVIGPASGVVANANNAIVDRPYPRHLGFDWPAPYRFQRLEQLLTAREFHTFSGFQAMQTDRVSEMARTLLPLMAAQLWAGLAQEEGLRLEALTQLAAWDFEMDPFAAEPLIFIAWTRALARRLAGDELAELAADYDGLRPLFIERVLGDVDGAAEWCDDTRTERVETCAEMASLALDDALAELQESEGASLASWRWGRAHEAVHRSFPLGFLGLFDPLVNIRQATGGSAHTLRRGDFLAQGERPYANIHAGGLRAVFDFADLDRSVMIIATGQSGHFLSGHYDDQAEIWRTGGYVLMSLNRDDAEAGSVGVIRLIPLDAE